jgi:proteasome lid subunit RPN8/RPN11
MVGLTNTSACQTTRIELSRSLYDQIIHHLLSVAPLEGVGLLAVPRAGQHRSPTKYYPGTNIDASSTRYTMDPAQVIAAFQDMDARQWSLGAIVHSHPASDPIPSPTDLQRAFYPDALLVIVGLVSDPPITRAWQVCMPHEGMPDHAVEILLVINDNGSSHRPSSDEQMVGERGGVKIAMTLPPSSTTSTAGSLEVSLGGFPTELERALEGYAQPALLRPASDGGWGVVENLCHLRDWEEVFLHRIETMLEQDNPALPALDDDLWAIERDYRGQEPKQALSELRKLRVRLLELLEGLPEDAWGRTGIHGMHGVVTIQWLVERLHDHGAEHLAQIRDALS